VEAQIHETGIAQNILIIIERAAHQHQLSSIDKIVLEIGRLSGVQTDSLEFAFSVLTPGTLLENTMIEYDQPPLLLQCNHCKKEYSPANDSFICPTCNHEEFIVLKGRQLLVKSIVGS
jgi:hydrogenase nickel incorporation protein HypA/HybF